MKTLFFISFTLLLLITQASYFTSPTEPLEHYKAYLRGLCTALSLECDLTPLSSCWDNNSALDALIFISQVSEQVANSPPQEIFTRLTDFFFEDNTNDALPVFSALDCETKLPFSHSVYEKLGLEGQGFEGIINNILYLAYVRPEQSFNILRSVHEFAEQGNFEVVGLLEGNYMSQASALMACDWRGNAKNSRRLFLKGICESLGVECPMETVNCMNEEESAVDLQFLHEWIEVAATSSIENMSNDTKEFLLGRGKELLEEIPKSAIECERDSLEFKLINERIGFDVWGKEWYEVYFTFLKEFPEMYWHYRTSEYELFKKNDLKGAGVVLGLEWLQIAERKKGKIELESA